MVRVDPRTNPSNANLCIHRCRATQYEKLPTALVRCLVALSDQPTLILTVKIVLKRVNSDSGTSNAVLLAKKHMGAAGVHFIPNQRENSQIPASEP